MSRLKITFFIFLSAFFLFPSLVKAIKARPPILLIFQENALSETETEITLIAHANMDTASVSLSIRLPPDLFLIEGETEWEGPMSAEAEQIIQVTILKPETGQSVIEGRAILRLPNDGVFEQSNRLTLRGARQEQNKASPSDQHGGKQRSIFDLKGE